MSNRFFQAAARAVLGLGVAVVGFSSCDTIEGPKRESEPVVVDDRLLINLDEPDTITLESGQKIVTTPAASQTTVLLEDYTGIQCGFCPPAGIEAERLGQNDRVIPVALHAGSLASPDPNSPYFNVDLRTPASQEYYQDFGLQNTPIGLINRIEFPFNGQLFRAIGWNAWEQYVNDALNEPMRAQVHVLPLRDPATNAVELRVNVKAIQELPATAFLVLWAIEDSIVTGQKYYDNPATGSVDYFPAYAQRHVLRQAITAPYGARISDAGLSAGEQRAYRFEYTPNAGVQPSKLSFVGFVHENNSRVIYQATEAKAIDLE